MRRIRGLRSREIVSHHPQMIGHVLGSNDPQFKPAGASAPTTTTALNSFTLRGGTGRTRLVSNLVAELKAPRRFLPFFLSSFFALLGGYITILFASSWIKASPLYMPYAQRRLGSGALVLGTDMVSDKTTYPPTVHSWRLRTTSTMPIFHFSSENFRPLSATTTAQFLLTCLIAHSRNL